ncbi:MAG: TIGR03618 family F420-dependent PPOX class oxidoreductase [Myxococcales bacterium]|nr:TIGR03618 family F420-dependent PPOX class oxidoreductase [Myxococcales bacterium]
MSRRDQIRMTEEEQRAFLESSRTLILCSVGADGVPHPMPMWFGLEDDGAVVMSTFTKSQKIKNLGRDPRVSLLAEAGESYDQLQGVVLYGTAELVPDAEDVADILVRVTRRSGAVGDADDETLKQGVMGTAVKRTGIRVRPDRVVSWDHRKLAGRY